MTEQQEQGSSCTCPTVCSACFFVQMVLRVVQVIGSQQGGAQGGEQGGEHAQSHAALPWMPKPAVGARPYERRQRESSTSNRSSTRSSTRSSILTSISERVYAQPQELRVRGSERPRQHRRALIVVFLRRSAQATRGRGRGRGGGRGQGLSRSGAHGQGSKQHSSRPAPVRHASQAGRAGRTGSGLSLKRCSRATIAHPSRRRTPFPLAKRPPACKLSDTANERHGHRRQLGRQPARHKDACTHLLEAECLRFEEVVLQLADYGHGLHRDYTGITVGLHTVEDYLQLADDGQLAQHGVVVDLRHHQLRLDEAQPHLRRRNKQSKVSASLQGESRGQSRAWSI